MTTIVLVHGAWHGAWCWQDLLPELARHGLHGVAIDLPGHGDDPAPVGSADLEAYVRRVEDTVAGIDGPVWLAGHSMGGGVISAAGERLAGRIAGLLFICAFAPGRLDRLNAMAAADTGSQLGAHVRRGSDRGTMVIDAAAAMDVFYHDCAPDKAAAACARLVPQALAPNAAPIVTTDARHGALPKLYVVCTADRAITADLQRAMAADQRNCSQVEMDCGHSPFVADPAGLADHIAAFVGAG